MVLIVEANIITPATSKAAPVNKVSGEFEPFIDIHITDPAAIKPMETNISRRCAFRIRVRGSFNGVWVSPPHPIGAPPKVLPRAAPGKYEKSTK
jgi:hypothetical protein